MKYIIYCGMLIVHYLVLFVDSSISDIPTTNNVIKQCMPDGGYCQNSWDCCSNRCLSFSYKCIRGPPSVQTGYMPNAPIENPTLIVETLDDLVNRFGNDDDKSPAQSTTTSTISSTSTSTTSITIHRDSPCIGIGYKCTDSSQCCSNDCLHYLDVNICIEQRNPTTTTTTLTSTTTTTVPLNGQCLSIGQKCYRNEECCSERCHGFLHQCVT
ncbi:hypothetical protein Bhyg_11031 [Pseudolycoriella hygida]|uniref:Uncharacterized protein n=1 Tax=Pseudolycoriella hygida TaxID=35572 RepID=A0A9Q0RZ83_9DIPT|nr:hypothetical protein Bhyg_11031 [Pseudolycoriella hygida]